MLTSPMPSLTLASRSRALSCPIHDRESLCQHVRRTCSDKLGRVFTLW